MREKRYQDLSMRLHQKNARQARPNQCQFELTFRCALHCAHCYTDCYNTSDHHARELTTIQVFQVMDKLFDAGVIWLCLTGGDPLMREDFMDIYRYARKKGFIVTIFTSAYSLTEEIVDMFQEMPPFVVEVTVNGSTRETYEAVTGIPGSYDKAHYGIDLLRERNIPLKIKMQVTRENFVELEGVRALSTRIGALFAESYTLYPRLNGEVSPCSLRLSPEEISGERKQGAADEDCFSRNDQPVDLKDERLFPCAVCGGDGFHIDPMGNMFLCNLLREQSLPALTVDIRRGLAELLQNIRSRVFTTSSACKTCGIRQICQNCPGKAYLETGDAEAPVPYYCSLAASYLAVLSSRADLLLMDAE